MDIGTADIRSRAGILTGYRYRPRRAVPPGQRSTYATVTDTPPTPGYTGTRRLSGHAAPVRPADLTGQGGAR